MRVHSDDQKLSGLARPLVSTWELLVFAARQRGVAMLIALLTSLASAHSEQDQIKQQPPRTETIEEGRDYWAFQKLNTAPPPKVRRTDRVHTPIDAFVLAQLEQKGLTFAPPADPQTLIRRVYFDLIGLPPSPEEVRRFAAQASQSKRPGPVYERLLERLLTSPHFGERWGRHWLDAVGYVDVWGADENAPAVRLAPGKWKYRDYVVKAFNQDKPYNIFLVEQLAGDELVDWRSAPSFTPEILERLIATGFWRLAIDDTDQEVLNIPSNRYATIFDSLEIFGSSVLGLTLQCARCHSHKYDPIPQSDFYRMMALLTPSYNPEQWVPFHQRALADIPPKLKLEHEAYNATIAELLKPLEEQLAQIKTNRQEQTKIELLQEQIAALKAKRKAWGTLQAFYETGPPPPTHILARGNIDAPGERVEPGFVTVLFEPDESPASCRPQGATTGRRLALAQWLTTPGTRASALVARVCVNRLWQQLFGKGIVATPGNFGRSGSAPTHPELLDWLANRLIEGGWRLKPLLKEILLSAVYCQSSELSPSKRGSRADPMILDPENRWLWRMPLRRLESEIIRDAILSASGQLDPTMGGEPLPVKMEETGKMVVAADTNAPPRNLSRRSLYLLSRRNYNAWFLSVFDQPIITTTCPQRNRSTVVLQALTLLNDPFVLEQAELFADRLWRGSPATAAARAKLAFWIAFGREPKPNELRWSVDFMDRQTGRFIVEGAEHAAAQKKALAHLCQMLFNSNEFLYVE